MDIIIFVVCLCFGLILTLIGLRNVPIAIISVVFNTSLVASALVDGVTEQIALSASIQEVSYNVSPALLLPLAFIVLSIVKVTKYR